MSVARTSSVTGDRLTWKVRRIAAELPELGRIRHVEGNPPSPTAWWVTIGFGLFCMVGIVLGNGGISDALSFFPGWALMMWIILGYLGSEKVVVLDRGLLIGSFAPFLRPYVVPFDRFEVGSITAVRPGWKLGAMLPGRTLPNTGRTAVWAWNGVAFVAALGPVARRKNVEAHGTFGMEDPERRQRFLWWFGTWRQPHRLVGALESALVDLGHPVAGPSQHVLPLVRISGNSTDSAVQVPRLVAALEQHPLRAGAAPTGRGGRPTSAGAAPTGRGGRPMSGFGRWSLWIGLGLLVVALICRSQGLIPATVILSIVGLMGLGLAAHDVADNLLERADLRHRAARVKREREREREREQGL